MRSAARTVEPTDLNFNGHIKVKVTRVKVNVARVKVTGKKLI